jgi:hypothetical protein
MTTMPGFLFDLFIVLTHASAMGMPGFGMVPVHLRPLHLTMAGSMFAATVSGVVGGGSKLRQVSDILLRVAFEHRWARWAAEINPLALIVDIDVAVDGKPHYGAELIDHGCSNRRRGGLGRGVDSGLGGSVFMRLLGCLDWRLGSSWLVLWLSNGASHRERRCQCEVQ